jgi:hypothetical protein
VVASRQIPASVLVIWQRDVTFLVYRKRHAVICGIGPSLEVLMMINPVVESTSIGSTMADRLCLRSPLHGFNNRRLTSPSSQLARDLVVASTTGAFCMWEQRTFRSSLNTQRRAALHLLPSPWCRAHLTSMASAREPPAPHPDGHDANTVPLLSGPSFLRPEAVANQCP